MQLEVSLLHSTFEALDGAGISSEPRNATATQQLRAPLQFCTVKRACVLCASVWHQPPQNDAAAAVVLPQLFQAAMCWLIGPHQQGPMVRPAHQSK